MNVDADGEWELTLNQPGNPSAKSLPFEASGEGPDYLGPFKFDGPTSFIGSHDGDSNFIVEAVPIDPTPFSPTIFNEIGAFEGSTTERVDGVAYLNIDADGEWALSTKE